ncbi:hypothetical protein R69776_06579 [Paraburkholderia nemoris]|uniref:Uncharacterized protein n=1 Tax=Paraburkholderia nemoris TaxID=2793076 RepID=A0ABM8SSN3_9BURK|nr:hypothetical protein R69776_06579 [Paraburkholderia nemoris]CAE6846214.1 hypothetical protein R75777_07317 [Paraburkholderia nemoris]
MGYHWCEANSFVPLMVTSVWILSGRDNFEYQSLSGGRFSLSGRRSP